MPHSKLLFAQQENAANMMQNFMQFLQEDGLQFAINLGVAILIFLAGRWVASILSRILGSAIRRGKTDETIVKFLMNLAYFAMLVLVIVAALDRLGIPTTSLAAAIAAGGVAIGLALQGSLSNFAAGVLIIILKPFRVGEYVEAGGTAGTVEEINLFYTILKSPDNKRIVVPNSAINGGTITNYSVEELRRLDLVVGCGYNDDLLAVKKYLLELLEKDERVLGEPAPVVAVDELADSSINLLVRPWVKNSDYWATKWDLTEKIKVGFDENGFTIPFPQQDVHVHQNAAD